MFVKVLTNQMRSAIINGESLGNGGEIMSRFARLISIVICIVLFASLVLFVSAKGTEGTPPRAPISAEYKTVAPEDAGPVILVELSDPNADFVVIYFGNELGRFDDELARYTASETTSCEINPFLGVPEGATKLWVYTANECGLSSSGCMVNMYEGFSKARLGDADAPNNTLEAYAVTVIISAAVISSIGYIFLRDPNKNKDSEREHKK